MMMTMAMLLYCDHMRRKQAGPSWGSQAQGFPPSHPVFDDHDDDDGTDIDEGDGNEGYLHHHYAMCSMMMTTTQQEL